MSPSEEQLRQALSEGESHGASLDPAQIIAGARQARHTRRVRIAAVAGTVATVALLGGGAVVLDNHTHTAPAADRGTSGQPNQPTVQSSGSANTGSVRTGSADACPATLPTLTAPRSSSPTAALLPASPSEILACTYVSPLSTSSSGAGGTLSTTLRLTGAQAAALAASVNSANSKLQATPCPAIARPYNVELALIARDANGASVPVVETNATAISGCNAPITNGVAVRYNWTPPAMLSAMISSAERQAVSTPTVAPASGSATDAGPTDTGPTVTSPTVVTVSPGTIVPPTKVGTPAR